MARFILSSFFLCVVFTAYSQAYFTSKVSGKWKDSSSWQLVSGTSSAKFPVAGDSVVVQSGHQITVDTIHQCQSLTVKQTSRLLFDTVFASLTIANELVATEQSIVRMNKGSLFLSGNMTLNQAALFEQNDGLVNIIGFILVTAPSSTGTTLLNLNNGVFNNVGGTTLTGTLSTRTAELFIGTGIANIIGTLTTITANAKIKFTGNGSLILSGIVLIANANSFTAGSGRVVYVGIPGSNQSVASLTYNRLVISGVGNGSKIINGSVIVTDSLTLLSDTLLTQGSGSLTLNNNATLIRTAGKLLSTPVFSGLVNLIYNNVLRDTTGAEMPSNPATLNNLTITNPGGIVLNKNVTLKNTLSLQTGELKTGDFILKIDNPAAGSGDMDVAVIQNNGYISGTLERTIGNSTGTRLFPFGIGSVLGKRSFLLDYTTAPAATGTLRVSYFDSNPPQQSGLPLVDGSVIVASTLAFYWNAEPLAGLNGGVYDLKLTAENVTGVTDYTFLRILKRTSDGNPWILNGVAGSNSGSNNSPVVVRTGMTGFSQFTIGVPQSIPTSIIEAGRILNLHIYPNPVSKGLQLSVDGSKLLPGDYTIRFFNQTGLLVAQSYYRQSSSNSSTIILPIPVSLGSGWYRADIRSLKSNDGYTFSFIVQ